MYISYNLLKKSFIFGFILFFCFFSKSLNKLDNTLYVYIFNILLIVDFLFLFNKSSLALITSLDKFLYRLLCFPCCLNFLKKYNPLILGISLNNLINKKISFIFFAEFLILFVSKTFIIFFNVSSLLFLLIALFLHLNKYFLNKLLYLFLSIISIVSINVIFIFFLFLVVLSLSNIFLLLLSLFLFNVLNKLFIPL